MRLARPALGQEELEAVGRVFESRQLTLGSALRAMEAKLADLCGTPYAVGCSNGTAALHLALMALGVGPGDEVVVPAYTFPATANAIVLCHGRPVFCDLAPGLDVTDRERIEAVLTPRTKAVMVVHLFGYPMDLRGVRALCEERGLPLVEDAAGALGSTVNGRPAGSWGTVGCFSFHPRKLVTTGEGGAAVTRDKETARWMRRLRAHGLEHGDFLDIGLNYRLPDILAAIAMPQLDRLETIVEGRNAVARRYDAALRELDGIEPPPSVEGMDSARHSYQAYIARAADRATRDHLLRVVQEHGVETQIGTYCVPRLTSYLDLGYDADPFPNAVDAADRGIALPLYESLTEDEQERVLAAVRAGLATAPLPSSAR